MVQQASKEPLEIASRKRREEEEIEDQVNLDSTFNRYSYK
jgi:hypothetical protein